MQKHPHQENYVVLLSLETSPCLFLPNSILTSRHFMHWDLIRLKYLLLRINSFIPTPNFSITAVFLIWIHLKTRGWKDPNHSGHDQIAYAFIPLYCGYTSFKFTFIFNTREDNKVWNWCFGMKIPQVCYFLAGDVLTQNHGRNSSVTSFIMTHFHTGRRRMWEFHWKNQHFRFIPVMLPHL